MRAVTNALKRPAQVATAARHMSRAADALRRACISPQDELYSLTLRAWEAAYKRAESLKEAS